MAINKINPLTKFSSYNYILTLYIMTPECANVFSDTGKLPKSSGATSWAIIAQTGGITNKDEIRGLTYDSELGPNKSGLNFHIDNLNILTYLLAADGQKTSSFSVTFDFDVIEPIGFTFMNKLTELSSKISSVSNLINTSTSTPTLYQQHYAIGIKFNGYDNEGNILELSSSDNSFNGYERIFPLIVASLKFKLDGKATIYSFSAVLQSLQSAFGVKRGYINTQATLQGITVGNILNDQSNSNSLINWLNNQQKNFKDRNEVKLPINYSIEWVKNNIFDAVDIKNSTLLADSEYNPNVTPISPVKTTKQSTVKVSNSANNVDIKSRTVTVGANTSIISLIDQIISRSKYVSETLKMKINEKLEAENKKENVRKLTWYSINPVTKILGRDELLNDWVYDIKYQIIPYEIPYVKSPYVGFKSKYYGPVKTYNYIFTGENSEIINLQMEYNNLFYTIKVPTTNKSNTSITPAGPTPSAPSGPTNDNSVNTNINRGGAILESVRADLYSPGDNVVANMKILGDPDYLMTSFGYNVPKSLNDKFTSLDGSINPYSGQLFIEIIFKVAEDYNLESGLLDVDNRKNIKFYPEKDEKILGNRGIIYKINSIKSSFSRGKFEQELEMFMVHPSELILSESETEARPDRQSNSSPPSKQTPAAFTPPLILTAPAKVSQPRIILGNDDDALPNPQSSTNY